MASDDSELQGEDLIRFLNFTVFVSLKGLKTTLLKTSFFSVVDIMNTQTEDQMMGSNINVNHPQPQVVKYLD